MSGDSLPKPSYQIKLIEMEKSLNNKVAIHYVNWLYITATYTQEKQDKYFGHDLRDFSPQSLGQLYLDEVKHHSPKSRGKQSGSAHESQERKKQRKLVGWGEGKWGQNES